jgi:tetratricopeptide (TPR) repeat protein
MVAKKKPVAKPIKKKGKSSPPSQQKKSKYPNLRYILLFTFAVFVLYGNTLYNKYSMDDDLVTYQNQSVHKGISGIPEIFTSLYSQGKLKYEYRPIVKSTYAIEFQLFGENPGVSHFINILLYLATAIFLFFLLKKFLKGYNILLPVTIVLLFIAHPIHTEVVSSLKNRDELLSFLSCLISMYFFVKFAETKKWLNILWGSFMFLFAYLSKSDALTFLVVIPLTVYFFTDTKPKYLIVMGLCILAVVIAARYGPKLYLPKPDRDLQYFENPLFFEHGRFLKMSAGLYCLIFYIRLLLFPHPLVFYYGYDQIPIAHWNNIWVIISLLIHLAIFIYAIMKIKEKHVLSYAILFYLVTISMFSNIVKPAVGIVAERFVYISSLGFCIAVAYLIIKALKIDIRAIAVKAGQRKNLIIVLVIILIPYSVKTITRNRNWKDHLSLYSNDIQYLEKSAKANSLFATELLGEVHKNPNAPETKDWCDLIVKHYKQAVAIYPKYETAMNNLGSVYFTFYQDYDNAIPCFRKAIQLNKNYIEAYANLGFSYEKKEMNDSAIYYYKKTIEIKNDYSIAYSYLANMYFKIGKHDEAYKWNEKLMEVDTKTDLPYINMANYCIVLGDTAKAASYLEKAIEIVPNNYSVCMNLAKYFKRKGEIEKSNKFYNMAMQASGNPQNKTNRAVN